MWEHAHITQRDIGHLTGGEQSTADDCKLNHPTCTSDHAYKPGTDYKPGIDLRGCPGQSSKVLASFSTA